MIIGTPKEIRDNEYRVAITPAGVEAFVKNGHIVLIENDAGLGSGFSDTEYKKAGAEIVTQDELYKKSEMIYKVKEFLPEEYKYLREGLIVFTYIHSNAFRDQTDEMIKKKIIGVAYEDITDDYGNFPLLRPMSEIAGKGGMIMALQYMQKINGGNGLMMARVHGVRNPHVTIIGAGISGIGAAEIATGLGNQVTILDIDINKLENAKKILPLNTELLYSDEYNLVESLKKTDVLLNCILWPKWRKDNLVTKEMLNLMKEGSLIVDIACDEGGAIETCKTTSHSEPVYKVDGIIHYCVDNVPAAFPKTSTTILSNTTLPYALELANKGLEKALRDNKHLRKGLSFYLGVLTLEETGRKQNRAFKTPEEVLKI